MLASSIEKQKMEKFALSLFSCGGIGDLALHALGIQTIISNELLLERHMVYKANNPSVECITGDIRETKSEIICRAKDILGNRQLDFLYATPPCQGMSKNGRGKLLNAIRAGLKPDVDERNLLIIPTMEIAKALNPETIILENVPEMKDTFIPVDGELCNIIDYISKSLGNDYVGKAQVVEFANYGVPQRRQRLITIFTKNQNLSNHFAKFESFFPRETHSPKGTENGKTKWITVRDSISHLPKLDASNKKMAMSKKYPLHKVPLLDEDKYFWVSNTPPEKGAFDNQCVNCGYSDNPLHGSNTGVDGINRSNTTTPIMCEKCGALLPRPWVKDGNEYRLMKGFTSAYKRMSWDQPSPALTRNLSYACSDNKLHPQQHRVLSLHEACILHTISEYPYKWIRSDGKSVSEKLIRELIGESIPPKGLEAIIKFVIGVIDGAINVSTSSYKSISQNNSRQINIFSAS